MSTESTNRVGREPPEQYSYTTRTYVRLSRGLPRQDLWHDADVHDRCQDLSCGAGQGQTDAVDRTEGSDRAVGAGWRDVDGGGGSPAWGEQRDGRALAR